MGKLLVEQRRRESAWARVADAARRARYGAVARFVRHRLGGDRHERRVAELASELFDATRHWHGLSRREWTGLQMAALLHDIGRSEDEELHPEVGARMIARSRMLPLTGWERRFAAFAARYHRGAVPTESMAEILRPGEYEVGLLLLSLLRAADGLDSRAVGHAEVDIACRGRKLVIIARPEDDSGKARRAFSKRKKYRLLERVMDCEVRLRVA